MAGDTLIVGGAGRVSGHERKSGRRRWSFAVDGKLRKDQQLVRAYGITGTPSLVVNGKYRITGNAALPSFDAMLDVVDYLVEIEKSGLKDASVAAE